MKKIKYYMPVVFVMIATMFLNSSCDNEDETDNGEVIENLTKEEESDLLALREEEKLARDVYLYAFEKYGLNVSKNISNSEESHMGKVLVLLTKYGLPDPASPDRGEFNNEELQEIYNGLTAKVDSSELDALIVGAIIEDLDIRDIELFKTRTVKEDILDMYDELVCGSRNHMRAYYPQVISSGGSYTPQFITQADLDVILSTDREKCGQ